MGNNGWFTCYFHHIAKLYTSMKLILKCVLSVLRESLVSSKLCHKLKIAFAKSDLPKMEEGFEVQFRPDNS